MKSEYRCPILNHPDPDAYLQLRLSVEDAEINDGVAPFAVAVKEGLAYLFLIEAEGEVLPMTVLSDISDFPEETEDTPVHRWWRESKPKPTYEWLRELVEEHGLTFTSIRIREEMAQAVRLSLN